MLVSPALIPNKNIFRHDPNTDSDYYVYFSKETVRKAAELYLKHNNHHKATYQHQDRVSGVLTVESWIKEGDSDKSKLYGYDLPNGTWFVKMKIENDELWQKIRSGELKGLSIEGYFTNKFEQMQKKEFTNQEVKTALKELLSKKKVKKLELGAIDDLNSLVKEFTSKIVPKYEKIVKEQDDWIKMGDKLKSKAETEYKAYNKNEASMLKLMTLIKKQAKELGVNVMDIKDYKKAVNASDSNSRIYKTYESIKKIKV